MQKIEKWLEENGIEYKKGKYGNPYYFNDGFGVDGLQITFFGMESEMIRRPGTNWKNL